MRRGLAGKKNRENVDDSVTIELLMDIRGVLARSFTVEGLPN